MAPTSSAVCVPCRYYDPATGQFLTRDPLSSVTREPYGYVGNNPINVIDPTGLGGLPIPHLPSPTDFVEGVVKAWDETAGEVVADIADTDLGSTDWGTSAAGLFNIGYGGWKLGTGGPWFAAGVAGTAVAGPLGVPPLLFGSYQLATGAARTGKGFGQFFDGVNRDVQCDDDQTLGANLGRFVTGVLPGPVNNAWDLLAGLL